MDTRWIGDHQGLQMLTSAVAIGAVILLASFAI